jgi:hypothetical protein
MKGFDLADSNVIKLMIDNQSCLYSQRFDGKRGALQPTVLSSVFAVNVWAVAYEGHRKGDFNPSEATSKAGLPSSHFCLTVSPRFLQSTLALGGGDMRV